MVKSPRNDRGGGSFDVKTGGSKEDLVFTVERTNKMTEKFYS